METTVGKIELVGILMGEYYTTPDYKYGSNKKEKGMYKHEKCTMVYKDNDGNIYWSFLMSGIENNIVFVKEPAKYTEEAKKEIEKFRESNKFMSSLLDGLNNSI